MSIYLQDLNKGGLAVRGSLLANATALTTALTWVDLGDPNAAFPFNVRNGGPTQFVVSLEGVFSGTVQLLGSENDQAPATTPCGASSPAVPILGQWSAPSYFTLPSPFRWIAGNVSAYTSGAVTLFVYGVFPR
jgi:hypothetical protein